MKKYLWISLLRTVRKSFGRYLALLSIVLLGVGFFAGLKNTRPLMIASAENYLNEHRTFDYRLVSTVGLQETDVLYFSSLDYISDAEGSLSGDAYAYYNGIGYGAKVMTVTEQLNTLTVVEGRMPEADDECVVDANRFSEKDIGGVIRLNDQKDKDALTGFERTEFTIVGTVRSPLYISHERGSSELEFGSPDFFVCLPASACHFPVYTEIYLKANFDLPQFGKEYAETVKSHTEELTDILYKRCRKFADYLQSINYPDIPELKVYVLTQKENMGLARYTQDTGIVDGIADIFPAFFALVAALVCLSTVSRMVTEESVQIGTLKALGYSDLSVAAKYLLYSLSAGSLGTVAGFFLGTYGFPKIITTVYRAIYRFCDYQYTFDVGMLLICIFTVLAGLLGVTLAAGLKTMRAGAAEVMRPKAPKAGKRIWAEKLPFLWKKLSFMAKVIIRNLFLNKKRIAMSMIGVGGCTALLVAGFGVRDNVMSVLDDEYGGILKYDLSVSLEADSLPEFSFAENCYYLSYHQISFSAPGGTDNIRLMGYDASDFQDVFFLEDIDSGNRLALPTGENALLSCRMADKWDIRVGDYLRFTLAGIDYQFTVSGIFNNYTGDYIIVDRQSISANPNTAYLTLPETLSHKEAEEILKGMPGITSYQFVEEAKEQFEDSLSSMNYVVLVLIVCSGALAFIVLYNLTNMNIMERYREIATVQVLGFYKKETAAYILRENIILACVGGGFGLLFGKWLLNFVIDNLVSDGIRFNDLIHPQSYLYAFLLTLLFSFLTNRLMSRKIEKINMAEALKSVE